MCAHVCTRVCMGGQRTTCGSPGDLGINSGWSWLPTCPPFTSSLVFYILLHWHRCSTQRDCCQSLPHQLSMNTSWEHRCQGLQSTPPSSLLMGSQGEKTIPTGPLQSVTEQSAAPYTCMSWVLIPSLRDHTEEAGHSTPFPPLPPDHPVFASTVCHDSSYGG